MNALIILKMAPAAMLVAIACAGEPERDNELVIVAPEPPRGVDFTVRTEPAPPAPPKAAVRSTNRVIMSHDDGFGQVVELRMLGDEDVRVIVNGRQIDEPRIKRDGKRVVVLGEDGKQLTTFELEGLGFGKDAPFADDTRFGKPGVGFFRSAPSQAKTPPVMIGISMGEPGEALRAHLGLKDTDALLVEQVFDGTPADDAGIQRWDVVVSINGSEGASSATLHEALMTSEPGDDMKLWVMRGCEKHKVKVELAPYDAHRLSLADKQEVKIRQAWPSGTAAPTPPKPFVWHDHSDMVKKQLSERLDGRELEAAMRAFEEAMGSVEFGFEPGEGYGVFEFRWDGDEHKLVIPKTAPKWDALRDQAGQNLRFGREQAERGAAHAEDRLEALHKQLEARMDRLAKEIDRMSRMLERLAED